MKPNPSANRVADAEAAAWIARLQGPDRDADLENALRAWLRSDPAHGAAFERATGIWNELTVAGDAFRERTRRRTRWMQISLAAAVTAAIALTWLFIAFRGDVYATAIGEQRLVKLEDGSWITLNTSTVIRARQDRSRRYVVLEQGEAIFDVAKDGTRPFVVAIGSEEVRATGTSFLVRRQSNAVSVTLLEGAVAVEQRRRPWSGRQEPRAAMHAGQSWHSQDNTLRDLEHARLEQLIAWRRGEIVFDNLALRDAIAEMNRYSAKPLVIQLPAAGDLPVSGVFRIRDAAEFAQTVAALYELRVLVEEDRIFLSGAPRP